MYGHNPKKKLGKPGQYDVYNIHSGCVVTFMDDGCAKGSGEPNQARRAAERKFAQRDEDGDPIFVPVEPLPRFILEADLAADKPLAGQVRSIDDRSKHPDFETLRDKFLANAKLRADFEEEMAQKVGQQAPSAKLAGEAPKAERAAKKKADADALKTGPMGKAAAEKGGEA